MSISSHQYSGNKYNQSTAKTIKIAGSTRLYSTTDIRLLNIESFHDFVGKLIEVRIDTSMNFLNYF